MSLIFIRYFYDQLLFCYYKMAYIKRERREQRVHISVGDCISVDRSYFGDEYGAQFPQSIQRFYGRVTYVYGAQKSNVK